MKKGKVEEQAGALAALWAASLLAVFTPLVLLWRILGAWGGLALTAWAGGILCYLPLRKDTLKNYTGFKLFLLGSAAAVMAGPLLALGSFWPGTAAVPALLLGAAAGAFGQALGRMDRCFRVLARAAGRKGGLPGRSVLAGAGCLLIFAVLGCQQARPWILRLELGLLPGLWAAAGDWILGRWCSLSDQRCQELIRLENRGRTGNS